jgi:hypothetical protein
VEKVLTYFSECENTSAMRDSTIHTVRQLVDAFGGTGAFAEFLRVGPSAVSNMLAQDEIPRGHHLDIYLECERRGLKLDKEALFGISEPKARPRKRVEARLV